MRRQYLFWSIAVFGIVGTTYGAYSLIYNAVHKEKLSIWALLLFIFGFIALSIFIIYVISYYLRHKKKKDEPLPPVEEPLEDTIDEFDEEEDEEEIEKLRPSPRSDDIEYERRTSFSVYDSPSSYSSTIYVKQVGYGPILRFDGNRILDMRSSTYYRIEGNMVMQEGYGPVYEIRGNQIKDAFGGYLYELSGSNVNKVFGGYYASISGNYITLYDLSMKYETTDSLSKRQILVVAALLFGKY